MRDNGRENIQTVTCFYEAVARGDLAMARSVLARDVEWIESDRTALWFPGTHQGASAVFNELILPAYGSLADFRAELEQMLAVGQHVVVIGRFRGCAKDTGKELNALTTHIWTLRHGKAVRVQAYHDSAHWPQALEKVAA